MELGREGKTVGGPPEAVRGIQVERGHADYGRSKGVVNGVDRPVRSLREEVRGRQEAARQRALGLLGRLPLTDVQRQRLSGLGPQPSLLGKDSAVAARYLVWWRRLDGLIRTIQATPAQALSKDEWDALVKAQSIAHQETGNLQSRLTSSSSFEAKAKDAFRRRPVSDDNTPSGRLGWQ